VIEDALSWLSGGLSEIIIHKENSTLGAPMQTISVKMKGKQALSSLARLGNESLVSMLELGLDNRVDEDKFLHVRLRLDKLVQGKGAVSLNSNEPVAKGKFKLEVYPGQKAIEVAEDLLMGLIGE
jgi:RNA binding exosome subunit